MKNLNLLLRSSYLLSSSSSSSSKCLGALRRIGATRHISSSYSHNNNNSNGNNDWENKNKETGIPVTVNSSSFPTPNTHTPYPHAPKPISSSTPKGLQVNGDVRVPPAPAYFNKDFFLLRDSSEFYELGVKNRHINDDLIRFEEEGHKYKIQGVEARASVTQFLDSFFTKFHAEEAIEKMMKGWNWPRPEYTWPNGAPYTAQQIKAKWNATALFSRNKGTWMHYNIERYFNKLGVNEDSVPELKQLFEFEEEVIVPSQIIPYRTEWVIAASDPNILLAGTVDFCGRLPDGSYVLIDWKRAKKLGQDAAFNSYGNKAKAPIDHLPDSEVQKYFLQLNTYKYILKRYYNMEVSRMILASLHPQNPKYIKVEVPDLEKEVVSMIAAYFTQQPPTSPPPPPQP